MSNYPPSGSDPFNEQPFDITKMSGDAVPESAPAAQPRWETAAPQAPRVEWKASAFDYVRLITKYRVWVVCGIIIGLFCGHLAYQQLGPEFTATAKVLVSKRQAVPTRQEGEAQTWGDRAEHIALIMSPLIVTQAIELHDLDKLPTLAGSGDPVEDIIDDLKVTRSAGLDESVLNILDVTFKSKSREDAKKVVNAVIDAYDRFLKSQHTKNTNELIQLVEKTSARIQGEIDKIEAEYEGFRDSLPVYVMTSERGVDGERISIPANIHQNTLKTLQQKRNLLLGQRNEVESQIQAIETALDAGQPREELAATIQLFSAPTTAGSGSAQSPLAATNPNAVQSSLDAQLLPLILRERQLLHEFGPDWPEVVVVQSQMQTLYQYYQQRGLPIPGQAGNAARSNPLTQLKTASGKDLIDLNLLSLRQKLSSIADQESRIDTEYAAVSVKAEKLASFLKQDGKFNARLDKQNVLWNLMETQASKLNIEKETPGYNLQQIAPARDQLSLKRIARLYGAGVIAICGLLGAVIFWIEWRDTTLKSVEEIRNGLALPILGTVPDFETRKRGVTEPLQPALCYYHTPGSPEAEAYHSVWTAFNVCVSSAQKLIQVTSPEPGDGKSTLISNLAIAIAQSGRRVLLIDADLRKPTLHRLFGLRQGIGVTDVANGEIDLLTAAQPTIVDGLSVLTSGDIPASPAELLASHQFSQLLSTAEREFDFVLIDSPPLLAVSDPCIVSPKTHGMILVLRLQKNSRAAARRAAQLIETNHINVIGIVANGSEESTDGYEYRQSYGDYLSSSKSPSPKKESTENRNPVRV